MKFFYGIFEIGVYFCHACVIFFVDFYYGLGLVEQRRRSRINEKMKALQDLIPNSNKVH